MKKNFKKSKFVILPALATLVLTGVASVTGTVAWFTANRAVTVSGMSITAKAGSNLLIANDNLTNVKQQADSTFASSLTQTINVNELAPASTVNATSFFYTDSAKADGSIDTGKYESATNATEDNGKKYYVDYVFQLKAINTETSDQSLYINSIGISYDQAADDTDKTNLEKAAKAFRCAFFIETAKTTAGSEFTANTTNVDKGMKFIYTPSGATNQTPNKAVKSASTGGKADSAQDLGDVTYLSAKTAYETVKTGTHYYKGVARLWLEGEDTSCTNDLFKTATNQWKFDLGFRLGNLNSSTSGEEAKTNIDITVTKKATDNA